MANNRTDNKKVDKKNNKTVIGLVVSDKMDKTIVVEVFRMVKHKLYGKYIKRSTKYYADDQQNQAKLGDKVLIEYGRPLSKSKNWKLVEVVSRAGGSI